MSLKLRGDVWHFRKMINGHIVVNAGVNLTHFPSRTTE